MNNITQEEKNKILLEESKRNKIKHSNVFISDYLDVIYTFGKDIEKRGANRR